MKRFLLPTSLCLLLILLAGFLYRQKNLMPVQAAEECACKEGENELDCNKEKQACYRAKIDEKRNVANTLANTISILNGQIVIQELQIKQTQLEIARLETEIQELAVRISGLNVSLDRLTGSLIQRVATNYKRRQTNPIQLLLISDSLTSFFSKYKYLQITQRHTQEIMTKAENQRLSFDQEKEIKEKKEAEVAKKKQQLQAQQTELNAQKRDQQLLLEQTRNDEARYQAELAKTLAEEAAIESLLAGNGEETKLRDVKAGDQIASIIVGASACSNGTHLHFEVTKDRADRNPADFLKPVDVVWNNQPDGPFGFGGSWDWPVNNAAKINQGFGQTWYARVRRAYGGGPHTGIDMVSKSSGDYVVKAVKDGTLYRGSIACGGGRLRYVRVDHHEEGISSYYLHVNY